MSMPEPKPIVNLTKKSYRQVCAYIIANINTDDAEFVIDFMTDALRNAVGFDPAMKTPRDLFKRKYEQQQARGIKYDPDQYEKYGKKHYEKKKEMFPDLSTTVVKNTPLYMLEKL